MEFGVGCCFGEFLEDELRENGYDYAEEQEDVIIHVDSCQ